MKLAGLLAVLGAVGIAAGVLAFVFTDDTHAPESTTLATPSPDVAPSPTPLPATWLSAFAGVEETAAPELIACRDFGDGRLDVDDALAGIDITLIPGEACAAPDQHADYYADDVDAITAGCESGDDALLVVAVASAGSDLLAPAEGESLGLIDIVNALRARADEEDGTATWLIVSTAAIFGAEQPQTSMERWLAREVGQLLDDEAQCLRAVMIGHSHGGATVTSVTAALEERFSDRMLGVLIDRTTALYDRPAAELPISTPILNFYQLNEGWHGVPIDAPNVRNFDESSERAPVAPSDGGGAPALVSHKTLDDAPNTQQKVVAEILAWSAASGE